MSNFNDNYLRLCELYNKYRYLISTIAKNAYSCKSQEGKVLELDNILKEIPNLPISWSEYRSKDCKFSQEFEDIIIFYNEQ